MQSGACCFELWPVAADQCKKPEMLNERSPEVRNREGNIIQSINRELRIQYKQNFHFKDIRN